MNKEFEYKVITKESEEHYFRNLLENAALIHQRKPDSVEWLKWKYFGSPYGESICVVAITKDNKIAGEVTFGQYQYVLNDVVIPCLISYQTMVHPNHQKKGLFSNLTKEVLRIAEVKEIELVLNFPNKASYTPFEKLNFTPINHIENRVYLVKSVSTFFNIISLKKSFFATSIDKISAKQLLLFDELKDKIHPLKIKDRLTPNRTQEFIKWRYFTFPLFDYRIIKTDLGWCITRIGKRGSLREVQIMEMFPIDDFNKEFIKKIKQQIITELNPNLILCNISKNHPAINFIKKTGFHSLPHNISFFTYAINKKRTHMLNESSWVVTATEFHRY
jgi:GNAT superfamily N-acetyltransferase